MSFGVLYCEFKKTTTDVSSIYNKRVQKRKKRRKCKKDNTKITVEGAHKLSIRNLTLTGFIQNVSGNAKK